MTESILFGKFFKLLESSKRTLIIAHKKPDGDTLGSSAAILNYLVRQGKAVQAFCIDSVPLQYAYIPHVALYSSDPSLFTEEYDLICICDAGDLVYAGVAELMKSLPKQPMIVDIDHHATNKLFGDLNLVFTDASSTAEVMYRFFRANNVLVDTNMATCLLTGIMTDTTSFTNPATNAVCLEAASHLLICGGRITDIISSLIRNKSVPGIQLWGRALERIKENSELGIASTVVRDEDLQELGIEVGEAVEGLSNFLGATLNVPVVMVLYEQSDGTVKGSLRSTKKDVAHLAKQFGGGGHRRAAGFTVQGKAIEHDGIWQASDHFIDPGHLLDLLVAL